LCRIFRRFTVVAPLLPQNREKVDKSQTEVVFEVVVFVSMCVVVYLRPEWRGSGS